MMETTTEASTSTSDDLFARISDSKFSQDELIQRFRETGCLWISSSSKRSSHAHDVLLFLQRHADACQEHWTVENRGDYETEQPLMEPALIKDLANTSFYVSTIINKTEEHALAAMVAMMPPPPIAKATHNGGAWLFVGKNGPSGENRKRKRSSLMGRAEHVDDVTHSGTWHYQLSGAKIWYIRPNKDFWDLGYVPDIASCATTLSEQTEKGTWRLKIQVQEGDVFVLNTRIWFHCTELEESNDWSMSHCKRFLFTFPLST